MALVHSMGKLTPLCRPLVFQDPFLVSLRTRSRMTLTCPENRLCFPVSVTAMISHAVDLANDHFVPGTANQQTPPRPTRGPRREGPLVNDPFLFAPMV